MTISFQELKRRSKETWKALRGSRRPTILVGTAACGRAVGASEVLEAFRRELDSRGLEGALIEVGCTGLCYAEPLVSIVKPSRPGVCYGNVTPEKARELVERCLVRDDPLPRDALGTIGEGRVDGIPRLVETAVFKPQVRRTLRNCGFIDPVRIGDYVANEGYSGLARALEIGPEQIIDQIKRSGLRGRGGAGFPTWRKWQLCREAQGAPKYVICNGSEGDPGTFSNKLLLESDPHSVLEGMLIAAYAVGAGRGYVYCPAEYALALQRLETALAQMEECGFLGDRILGSSFGFRITIKEGAGAYICGEETALVECIEGRRGVPRLRPPFPPTSGLWGLPTVINNVETLACAALIAQRGAEWFAELGTDKSKGTKLFCLSGNVKHGGVIEVPFGMTLREIVQAIGGGTSDGRPIKAVHTGGPGGGCLPPSLLDTPVDQDSLAVLGSSIGSGGVVVIDEDACIVDLARNSLDFAQREACGQCVPCRLGTRQMFDVLTDISRGRGQPDDLELLAELAEGVRLGSLCGLGQTAANTLLSTIRYFPDDYQAHIQRKQCPTAACTLTADEEPDPSLSLLGRGE